jgi:hypothetical protein
MTFGAALPVCADERPWPVVRSGYDRRSGLLTASPVPHAPPPAAVSSVLVGSCGKKAADNNPPRPRLGNIASLKLGRPA